MKLKPIVFIVGPTAVGKSAVAFLLAKKIQGEIVSCDSMQVYKEISIASNKPRKSERDSIPHHLIDIISISKEFNVAAFYQRVKRAIQSIHRKGKIPIIAGGSGLYMSILLDGIFEEGSSDQSFREELKRLANIKGATFLYNQLRKKDSVSAKRIHPNDTKRIIRALEVTLSTGRPFSELQQKRQGLWGKYSIQVFVLNKDREVLYDHINKRVDEMVKKGLVKEIRNLEKKIPQHIKSLIKINGIEVKSSRFKREPYSYSIYKVNGSIKELFKSDPIYGSSIQAIWNGIKTTLFLTWYIIIAFYMLIKGLILGQGLSVELGGPVRIAQITGDAARMGLPYLINFSALLSINLAIINALPFPALDGGRILFIFLEKIIGRPIKKEIEGTIHYIGFILLMVLVLLVTYKDIMRFFQ